MYKSNSELVNVFLTFFVLGNLNILSLAAEQGVAVDAVLGGSEERGAGVVEFWTEQGTL